MKYKQVTEKSSVVYIVYNRMYSCQRSHFERPKLLRLIVYSDSQISMPKLFVISSR